ISDSMPWKQNRQPDPNKAKKQHRIGRDLQIEIRQAVYKDRENSANAGEKNSLFVIRFGPKEMPDEQNKNPAYHNPKHNGRSKTPLRRRLEIIVVCMIE